MSSGANPEKNVIIPVMTQEKFAQETGLRITQVRGQVQEGNLPTIKIGKLRMINLLLVREQCIER